MASPLVSVLLLVAVIQVSVADTGFLFDQPNYQGASKFIDAADGDTTCYNILDDFNDRAESIRVTAGSCWFLFDDYGCQGDFIIANRDNPDFGGMNNRITSYRQC